MKQRKHIDPHHPFTINTGYIYTELCNQWPKLPRELFEQLEWKLKTIRWQKKMVTVAYSENMKTNQIRNNYILNSFPSFGLRVCWCDLALCLAVVLGNNFKHLKT